MYLRIKSEGDSSQCNRCKYLGNPDTDDIGIHLYKSEIMSKKLIG